jgi:hypothetical protein
MQTDKYGAETIMTWRNEDCLAAIGVMLRAACAAFGRSHPFNKTLYFDPAERHSIVEAAHRRQISSPHNDHSCITRLSHSLANVAIRSANADISAR